MAAPQHGSGQAIDHTKTQIEFQKAVADAAVLILALRQVSCHHDLLLQQTKGVQRLDYCSFNRDYLPNQFAETSNMAKAMTSID